MPDGMLKFRFWQSRKVTLQGVEMGFDILKILSRSQEPQSVTDLAKKMGYAKVGTLSGLLANILLVLHKVGAVEGDGKISRTRLSLDMTRVRITPAGRQLMKESRSRHEFGRRLIERS